MSPLAGLTVTRFDAPVEAIDTVIRPPGAHRRGRHRVPVSKADGRIYYYDVNATSNFVAAEAVVGFDPTARFATSSSAARREARPAAA